MKSIFNQDGGHYNIFHVDGDEAMSVLRSIFPKAKTDEMNFVLFSTSGIHGSYRTIEQCILSRDSNLTFLIIHPRLVCMKYGEITNIRLRDIPFLLRLRKNSMKSISKIGINKGKYYD